MRGGSSSRIPTSTLKPLTNRRAWDTATKGRSRDAILCRLVERKRRLARLIGRAKHAIRFIEHLANDGPTVFDHVCRMGLGGIVSKKVDAAYRSGPSKVWLKSKNPASEAVRREREEYRR